MAQVDRSPSYSNIIREMRDDGETRNYPESHVSSKLQLEEEPEHAIRKRPSSLELNTKYISSEMIAPMSPPPSRFKSKWGTIFTHGRTLTTRVRQPRAVRIYYKRQQKDIEVLREARKMSSPCSEDSQDDWLNATTQSKRKRYSFCDTKQCQSIQLSVGTAARLTFGVNLLLLFAKLAATIQSGSLSVLSSLIDSVLDLFSGMAIGVSSYLIKHYDRFHYPIGRNRLESVAIVITASVMGTAALQVVIKAIEDIADSKIDPNINAFSGSIIGATVLLKGGLFILCVQVNNPSVRTLAVDHRIVSNVATLLFGLLGTYLHPMIDPIGAILLALFIIINWILVGYQQVKNLVGRAADRRFLLKLTWIAAYHDSRIETVDTVRAYTFGVNYLVEVHVQLAPGMPLRTAHNIGERLQQKLESLDEVERAFVHLDFETAHSPSTEHKDPSPIIFQV